MIEMKTLTIKQPWAWLIAAGHKDVENRGWATHFRGRFLIHAGKSVDMAGIEFARRTGVRLPDRLILGAIIGAAEIYDCLTVSKSRWFFGPFGFALREARELPPFRCPGKLGFWNFDETQLVNFPPDEKGPLSPEAEFLG